MDEEMWPAEAFGGVSDDQFWDDLASDKPLTTTARSAQHESSASRSDGRARGRRPWNSSAYPESGAYAEPTTEDGTVVMPAQSAAQPVPPVQPVTQPVQTAPQSATQPVPSMTSPARGQSAQASPFHVAPVHAASMWAGEMSPATSGPQRTPSSRPSGPPRTGPLQGPGNSPSGYGGPPSRSGTQPSETRGRRHAVAVSGSGVSAEDDPLTSTAFSLRSSGPVDGNSQQGLRRQQDFSREQHDAVLSQETRAFRADGYRSGAGYPGPSPAADSYRPGPVASPAHGGTPPSPYAARLHRDLPRNTPAAQPANSPSAGPSYGYQASPAVPADDPRHPDSARSHADAPAPGDRSARPAYPARSGTGYQPGGINQGSGRPGDARRGAPYDPREEYPRLTRQAKGPEHAVIASKLG